MNKYRSINPIQAAAPETTQPLERIHLKLNGGIALHEDAQNIELNQSPELNAVRIEKGGIRADFDRENKGDPEAVAPPTKNITALGEHRFVQDDSTTIFSKLFRLYPNAADDLAKIDSYDDGTDTWTAEATATDIDVDEDVLLSWRSRFNKVFFAPDTLGRVFKWDNSRLEHDEGNNFPSENLIGGYNGLITTSAVITPADAVADQHKVHFNVTVSGPTVNDGKLTIAVLHNGAEVKTKEYTIPKTSDVTSVFSLTHEVIEFIRDIANNDTVSLQIKSTSSFPLAGYNQQLTRLGSNIEATGDNPGFRAVGDSYIFDFHLHDVAASGGTTNVGFYVTYDGMAYTQLDEKLFAHGRHTHAVSVTDRPLGFRILLEDVADDTVWSLNDPVPADTEVYVNRSETLLFEVHGFNDGAPDSDATKGVTYSTTGAIQNVIDLVYVVDPGEPLKARYLGVFADRLIALQVDGDVQRIGWSASGDPEDWVGIGANEGSISESRSAPIDDLMALIPLNSNVAALYRKRSIMRVVQTGIPEPALAIYPWIENLGTESPFSIVITHMGHIFLANDKMVYLLNESSLPVPIGFPIHQRLLQDITDTNVGIVEGSFNRDRGEYILTVPTGV